MIEKIYRNIGFIISTAAAVMFLWSSFTSWVSGGTQLLLMMTMVIGLIAQISVTLTYILEHLEKRPKEPSDVH